MEQAICPVPEKRTQMYENTKQSVLPRSVLSQLKLRILFGVIYRFAANALNEKKSGNSVFGCGQFLGIAQSMSTFHKSTSLPCQILQNLHVLVL